MKLPRTLRWELSLLVLLEAVLSFSHHELPDWWKLD